MQPEQLGDDGGQETPRARARTAKLMSGMAPVAVPAVVVFVVDQVSKRLVMSRLPGRFVDILGGAVRLDFTRNSGAAFGILPASGWLFVGVAVVVVVGAIVLAARVAALPLPVRIALGLVLGGATGNAVDRIRLGYVVDFIDLRWWPVFNVADSAIVAGALTLALLSVLGVERW